LGPHFGAPPGPPSGAPEGPRPPPSKSGPGGQTRQKQAKTGPKQAQKGPKKGQIRGPSGRDGRSLPLEKAHFPRQAKLLKTPEDPGPFFFFFFFFSYIYDIGRGIGAYNLGFAEIRKTIRMPAGGRLAPGEGALFGPFQKGEKGAKKGQTDVRKGGVRALRAPFGPLWGPRARRPQIRRDPTAFSACGRKRCRIPPDLGPPGRDGPKGGQKGPKSGTFGAPEPESMLQDGVFGAARRAAPKGPK